jgi:uncharacterized protein (DUF849 family)
VDPAVAAVRAACRGTPVGVTTGAWIEPDLARRIALIRSWAVRPDFASVNLSEPGAAEVARLLMDRGVGVEAGLWNAEDVERLAASGLASHCERLLVEVFALEPEPAVAQAREIDDALDRTGVPGPRLHHGLGRATWAVLDAAIRSGRDVRIGLEDTLELPDESRAQDNAELVAEAVKMIARSSLP